MGKKNEVPEGKKVAWQCKICGYIETGYPEGLPKDYHCPVCNAPAKKFKKIFIDA